MLVSRAKNTVRDDGNGRDVLKDLDEAHALSTQLSTASPRSKNFGPPVIIHRLRLGAYLSLAYMSLEEDKKALED